MSIIGCAGPTPAIVRQKVDDALASFQLSSTNVRLSPKVATAFSTLDQTMLVPSLHLRRHVEVDRLRARHAVLDH